MADKRKYIQEYLTKHNYMLHDNIGNNTILDEIYNLYKYGKIANPMNKDLYGYYAVYFVINGHIDEAIKFNEYALKHNIGDEGAFDNLVNIYINNKDNNNLIKMYNQSINNGHSGYIDNLIELYKDNNDMDKINEIFDMLINDKQKNTYLTNVCEITDFKFTKIMLNTILTIQLQTDAPLSLKLMKSVFNTQKN